MKRYPKVLISYFFGSNKIPLGSSCARALKVLGCEVLCFDSGVDSQIDRFFLKPINKLVWNTGLEYIDISRNSRWNNQNLRQRLLEKAIIEFKPNILLVLRGHGFNGEYLNDLKQKYKIEKIVGWWVKGPKWFDLMKTEAEIYDHYFCIHKVGYTEKDRIYYFPVLAVDNLPYRPIFDHKEKQYKYDITFVGGWTEKRQEILGKIADFTVTIYGPKWRRKNLLNFRFKHKIKGAGIWENNLVNLYNTTKIALNISAWDTEKFSGLNFRVFDIPACGSFLLTDYSDELKEYFMIGEEIETYRNINELNDKLLFYLKNEVTREKIALRGYEKVLSFDTFEDKMAAWLKKVWFSN